MKPKYYNRLLVQGEALEEGSDVLKEESAILGLILHCDLLILSCVLQQVIHFSLEKNSFQFSTLPFPKLSIELIKICLLL